MHIRPIFVALLRNKAGAILIGLQLALTLAIVCNALFIIAQRLDYISRTSGVDETGVFALGNLLIGHKIEELPALTATDLATIRQTPGVVDAYFTNSYPLRGGGWSTGFNLQPDQKKSTAQSTIYFTDEHALNTLGTHLIAGRNFTADEVRDLSENEKLAPAVIIVTEALARKLFPDGSALGKTIYLETRPSVIVGIVDRLQTPWTGNSWSDKFFLFATLVPARSLQPFGHYLVRAEPGHRDEVMKSVQDRLFAVDRMRVIVYARSYGEVRSRAYKKDRGMAILMGIVCTALLLVTAAGIVGLASFWVGQRHRQIGIRRALGATRGDILRYFQTENLLIAGVGVIIGAAAAIGLNLWLVTHYEMARLSPLYVLTGAVAILLLGQLAVLQPALRASRVPPVTATRAA